jgi:hypothetical protein
MKDQVLNKFFSIQTIVTLLFICTLPLFLTLPLDVIDIDSSQYAEISREILESGNPFFIHDNGRKYLDKPGLTFWKISLSFLIFGYQNFAFRIPALLISLLSLWGIYKLTELYSGSSTRAWLAVFLYSLSPGLYSMLVDPKIDVYLTAYLILVHCFYYLGYKKNVNYYYLMYFAMGLGFITKGPIAMVIPAISIGMDILIRRDWKRLGELKLFPGVLLSILPPLLWSIPLYMEFQTYGPYFFLWVQSFGRFYLKRYNQSFNPMFFYSNFSWAFGIFILPFLYYIAIGIRKYFQSTKWNSLPKRIWKNEFKNKDFTIGFWLFLFLFLISFSRFQLPQYIYWCLPPAAILGSGYLESLLNSIQERKQSKYYFSLPFILFLFTAVLFLGATIAIPILSIELEWHFFILPILFSLILVRIYKKSSLPVFYLAFVLCSISLFFSTVGLYVYPMLTSYQPAHEVGDYLRVHEPNKERLFLFGIPASKRSYAYYAQRYTKTLFDKELFENSLKKDGERFLLVQDSWESKMNDFFGNGIVFEKIQSFPAYKVATPELKFFLKSSRGKVTNSVILFKASYRK